MFFKTLLRTKSLDSIMSESSGEIHGGSLRRVLGVWDLTFFGIAAIIGAGSFGTLGAASFRGGPGVIVLFVICGVACAFTALCYSEFASRIPVAGSAYTYAYASMGELMAWVIGWALTMEYSIGNIYIAYSWSDYFTSLLSQLNIHVPDYLTCSYMDAWKAFDGKSANEQMVNAWNTAPVIGGLRIILDLPGFAMNIFITTLVFIGIHESRALSNLFVLMKLAVIALVILIGGQLVLGRNLTGNWLPEVNGVRTFMPNGFAGVMASVSGVFFAYIGFDAVSVLAEECRNPQRDLPRGMIYSLVLCTAIYILLSLVLTGAVSYEKFDGINDPLAFIFSKDNLDIPWMQMLVSFCAVVAMTSVMLVFQLGQPRIWLNMSRDGLLPPVFQKVHPKFNTPSFATIITGTVVGIPMLFTDANFILDFTSIATIFAFLLVCGGVLLIPRQESGSGVFKLPYVNGKFIFPTMVVLSFGLLYWFGFDYLRNDLLNFNFTKDQGLDGTFFGFMNLAMPKMATIIYLFLCALLALLTFLRSLSLIPVLGVATCSYLLTGMTFKNWVWFFCWMIVGLVIYFSYGYRHSRLARQIAAEVPQ